MKEHLRESTDSAESIITWTKKSLSLLEKETWINFFKKAGDWIKNLFSFWDKKWEREWDKKWDTHSETCDWDNNLKVSETWNYISNGWTFYSPSKWVCKRDKYRWVCSTGSFNVLRKLWLPKVSDSTEVDLKWDTLTQMWLSYIWKVDPKNPWKNWYKPQNGDTAVWPKFKRKSWKTTQHQATYVNGHWVSDNIQNSTSCYRNEPNEPECLIYRYNIQQS